MACDLMPIIRPVGAARRNAATVAETAADRTEKQALRDLRQAIKTNILDVWATLTQAQKIAAIEDLAKYLRRTLKFVL